MVKKPEECFVIMPISDPDNYEKGHFQHVYDDIVSKACETAGFKPVRADDVLETNLIHLDVLKRIIETPMAVCDLSNRNPNVLFELGLRQAFDKPVVLIQEKGTPAIFDIAPLRYTEYRKERVYHQVLEDQKSIADAITATKKATDEGSGLNSMVKLLSLTSSAQLKDFRQEESNPMMQVLMAEMGALRQEFRQALMATEHERDMGDERRSEMARLERMLKEAEHMILSGEGDKERLHHGQMLCDECHAMSRHMMRDSRRRKMSPRYRHEVEELYERISELRKHASRLLETTEGDVES